MDAQKVADRFRAALRAVRSAVRLPATVRAVQTLVNRARRLEEALAAVRAEPKSVLNHSLFAPVGAVPPSQGGAAGGLEGGMTETTRAWPPLFRL
jgi:hypothetical protein